LEPLAPIKMKVKFLHSIFFVLCLNISQSISAQLVDVIVEEFGTSTGTYPEGHTTYRVYARLEDSTDFLYSVFGTGFFEEDANRPLIVCDNVVTPGSTTCWNHPLGGLLGSDILMPLCNIIPEVCYDSFVTIGRANSGDPGPPVNIFSTNADSLDLTFGSSHPIGEPSQFINGNWFAMPGDVNGFPTGPDNRVLIMQVTCPTGTLQFQINLIVHDEGNVNNSLRYVHTLQDVLFADEIDGTFMGLVYPLDPCYGSIPGCTDPTATNFNPSAVCDDGTCNYDESGCTYPTAMNYNSSAVIDDGSCIFPGCTDPLASNYNHLALFDNGTCEYIPPCPADLNGDGIIGVQDLLILIANYGSTCP
jgi:hypothetical protein